MNYKVIVTGERGSGKTSLIRNLVSEYGGQEGVRRGTLSQNIVWHQIEFPHAESTIEIAEVIEIHEIVTLMASLCAKVDCFIVVITEFSEIAKSYLFLTACVGAKYIIIIVNKMDLMPMTDSESHFLKVQSELQSYMAEARHKSLPLVVIPATTVKYVSSNGWNETEWYRNWAIDVNNCRFTGATLNHALMSIGGILDAYKKAENAGSSVAEASPTAAHEIHSCGYCSMTFEGLDKLLSHCIEQHPEVLKKDDMNKSDSPLQRQTLEELGPAAKKRREVETITKYLSYIDFMEKTECICTDIAEPFTWYDPTDGDGDSELFERLLTLYGCAHSLELDEIVDPVVGYFWDMENIHIPKRADIGSSVQSIRHYCCQLGREVVFVAVLDHQRESRTLINDLNDCDVSVSHIMSDKKDAADKTLIRLMAQFVILRRGLPTVLVLLSGDTDFSSFITDMKKLPWIRTVLINKLHFQGIADRNFNIFNVLDKDFGSCSMTYRISDESSVVIRSSNLQLGARLRRKFQKIKFQMKSELKEEAGNSLKEITITCCDTYTARRIMRLLEEENFEDDTSFHLM